MSKQLTSALLVSLGLHAALIAVVPQGQGWRSQESSHTSSLHAALRLPRLARTGVTNNALPMRSVPQSSALATENSPDESDFASDARIGLPLPETPAPYDSTALTERPAALDALPSDLETALPAGQSGRALLLLEIDEKGKVIGITPESSDLDAVDLEKITQAFKEMRFLPGRIGRTPVRARMRIEITVADWRNGFGDKGY